MRCFRIDLDASYLDGLVEIGLLPAERRGDHEAVKAAVMALCEAGYLARKRDADATRDGIRYVRIRFSRPAIAALVEAGFLPRPDALDGPDFFNNC